MKKQILFSALAVFACSALLLNGCKKDDTTAPVVTVNGGSSRTVSLNNHSMTDPGATADDGSSVSSDWSSSNPNFDVAGTYNVTYKATDGAGNEGSAILTVTVKNDADSWAGTYLKANIVDSVFSDAAHTAFVQKYTWTHDMVVSSSSTVNNKIYFEPFLDYSNITASEKVYGNVSGATITIPSQTAHGIGSPSADHTFQGTGAFGSYLSLNGIRLVTSDQTTSGTAYDVVYFVK